MARHHIQELTSWQMIPVSVMATAWSLCRECPARTRARALVRDPRCTGRYAQVPSASEGLSSGSRAGDLRRFTVSVTGCPIGTWPPGLPPPPQLLPGSSVDGGARGGSSALRAELAAHASGLRPPSGPATGHTEPRAGARRSALRTRLTRLVAWRLNGISPFVTEAPLGDRRSSRSSVSPCLGT